MSQARWLRARHYLNQHRYELTQTVQDLYPRSWRVAGSTLLAAPGWLPAVPLPLDTVTLSWQPGPRGNGIDGTEAASAGVRPLREEGGRSAMRTQSAGAALLRLAWQHRATLLAQPGNGLSP